MTESYVRGRGPQFPILDRIVQYESQPGYVVFMVPSNKRIRVRLNDDLIADTVNALIMQESGHLPVFYFPIIDVRADYLSESLITTTSPFKGVATHYTLNTGSACVEDACWRYLHPAPGCPPIADHVAFYWNKMSRWYEEDEEIFVHARDPYRRIDCLPSSRRVQVVLDGEVVADTRRAVFLFETGLRTRFYMPIRDTQLQLLRPSRLATRCPYKGEASYYHLKMGNKLLENLVWSYAEPSPECSRINGLVSFYDELVDKVIVDGAEQQRPG